MAAAFFARALEAGAQALGEAGALLEDRRRRRAGEEPVPTFAELIDASVDRVLAQRQAAAIGQLRAKAAARTPTQEAGAVDREIGRLREQGIAAWVNRPVIAHGEPLRDGGEARRSLAMVDGADSVIRRTVPIDRLAIALGRLERLGGPRLRPHSEL